MKVVHEHKRIIFNGNGYDDAWVKEAEKRGLLNLKVHAGSGLPLRRGRRISSF